MIEQAIILIISYLLAALASDIVSFNVMATEWGNIFTYLLIAGMYFAAVFLYAFVLVGAMTILFKVFPR